MLTIRLSRTGKRHAPQYRIVVQEKTQDPWAPAKEVLGNYNPRTSPSTVTLNKERAEYWIKNGAQASDTVHNILVKEGVIKADKINPITITKKRKGKLEDKRAAAEEAKAEAEEAKKAAAEEAKAKAEAEKAEKEAATAEEAPAATEVAPAEETPASTEEAPSEEK